MLTTPKEAFGMPTQDDLNSGNPDFWSAKIAAIPKAMMLTFWSVPDNQNTYPNWLNYYRSFFKPNAFWDRSAAGYNDAFEDAGIWLWMNDPNSAHLKNIGG